jgi:hypothetical protein
LLYRFWLCWAASSLSDVDRQERDVMRSYHFLRIHKAPIGMGSGRHPDCQTVHVYAQTPGGFAVEFGWSHRRLDDATHEPVVYPMGSPVDVWGGEIQSSEFELG